MEFELGQMVIVSAYGRGATAQPAHAALLTVIGGGGKVTIGVGEPEILELITALTRQLDNIRQVQRDRNESYDNTNRDAQS